MFYLPWFIAAKTTQVVTEFWIDQAFPKAAQDMPAEPEPDTPASVTGPAYDWNKMLVEITAGTGESPFHRHPSDRWDNRFGTRRKASRKRRQ